MARAIRPDDWPATLSDADIIAAVGGKTFMRAVPLGNAAHVLGLAVAAGGQILTASVRGSGSATYQTMVSVLPHGWRGTCSCPVSVNCKHSAALVLHARSLATTPPVAPWRSDLETLLAPPPPATGRLALEVSLTAPHPDEPAWVTLRPLTQGARGWKRSGISWVALLNGEVGERVPNELLDPLRTIAALRPIPFYYKDEALDLGSVSGRWWPLLREAVQAGLVLTTEGRTRREVLLADPLRVGLAVRRDSEGQVLITSELEVSECTFLEGREVVLGAGSSPTVAVSIPASPAGDQHASGRDYPPDAVVLHPLGRPAHTLAGSFPDGRVLLAPLSLEGHRLAGRLLDNPRHTIVVPAGEVPEFEQDLLPALARSMPVLEIDEGLALPEEVTIRPVLELDVASVQDVSMRWLMRYVDARGRVRREVVTGDLIVDAAAPAGGTAVRSSHPSPPSRSSHPSLPSPSSPAQEADARPTTARELQGRPVPPDPAGEVEAARAAASVLFPLTGEHGILWHAQRLTGIEVARFVVRTLPVLRRQDAFDVEVVGAIDDFRQATGPLQITTDVSDDATGPDWFSLRVKVRVGADEVPLERLMAAVAANEGEVLLDSGTWVDLSDKPEVFSLVSLMEQGRDLADPATTDPGHLRVSVMQAGYYAQLEALGVVGEQTARWRKRVGRLLQARESAASSLASLPVPSTLRTELRDYQVEGYRWLATLRSLGLGGVLADDMGLGKTLQVLAAICHGLEEAKGHADAHCAGSADGAALTSTAATPTDSVGALPAPAPAGAPSPTTHSSAPPTASPSSASASAPVLVVAPTSVVSSWAEQAARFAPHLRVRTLPQTSAKRGTSLAEEAVEADVIVTTYAIVRIDEEEMAEQEWSWVVLDEAQMVKNHASATYKAVRRLRTPSTLAITGTPLENSLMDLWSLMSLGAPGLLPGIERFKKVYRTPIEHGTELAQERLEALRARLRPFLLRRTKNEVALDLPSKTEQVLTVQLAPAHKRAYEARLSRERQKVMGLLEDDSTQARFSALRSLTILRQMALDPTLVEGEDAAPGRPTAKIELLLQTLTSIVAEGHKALVFSQFTRYLDRVRTYLEQAGLRVAYMDGSTTDRASVINTFRQGKADAFLISLKAGGFGLTLTEADYVFLLDPWWNPQAEEQAVDRVHRIGQDSPVMVYRLVAAGTIEEKVMALKEKKAALFSAVVAGAELPESLDGQDRDEDQRDSAASHAAQGLRSKGGNAAASAPVNASLVNATPSTGSPAKGSSAKGSSTTVSPTSGSPTNAVEALSHLTADDIRTLLSD